MKLLKILSTTVWKNRQAWIVLAGLTYALALPSSYAQTVFGTITGTVTDPSGAVVPDAKVIVRGQQTGTTFEGTTTSAGSFNFPQVPVGGYDVTVTAAGFQSKSLTGVQVNLQVTSSLKIVLAVGTAVQSVTVNANALELQTATSSISGSITQEQYNKLPLALGGVGALRSPEAFIFLLPGTTGPGTSNNNSNGVFFSKIAGGQNYGAEVLIDGLSQQRSENGSSFDEEAPSVDALRELTVTQAVPPAEYNRTTGGFENFATKSGSNTYHGTAYDIFRNTVLDANLWFNGGRGAQACAAANDAPGCDAAFATPVDQKNDYGVTFGGPVWIPKVYNGHDRLFFFFSWEHLQYNLGATTIATVPTAQELAGDFSNPAFYDPSKVVGTNPCDGSPVYQGQIFDPSTTRTVGGVECRTAFPGNIINTPLSPAALNAMSYFPKPTNNGVFNNFSFSSVSPIANTTMTVRIDANITQKSHLWSSYSSRDNNRVSGTPQILPYPIDPNTWKQDFETHFWRLGWDYSFTPALLNHLIIGSNRSNSINFAFPVFDGINYSQKLGIGNADSMNFPVLTNGILTQEGMPNNGDNIDNGLRAVESVSWQKGAHSLTFGTDDRYQQYSPINNNSPAIGFCPQQTSAYTGSGSNGNALASELLGDACSGSQNVISHQSRWISWYFSGYVQDDWKVSPNLTLNLGVNYSVDVPRHEAQNYTSNFSPTALDPEVGVPGALVFATECSGCNSKWADTYYKDIAPRVGFAYSPGWLNDKTVIHGAGGIIYGPLQYDDFGGSMNAGYKSSPVFPSKNGFDPSFEIDAGYPAFPAPPILDPGLYNGTFMPGSYIEKGAGRPAAIYNWDLEVQQQVVQNLIMSVGYIGSAGQNLQANNQNINNVPYAKEFSTGGNTLNAALLNNPYGVPVPFPSYFNLWGNGITIQQALRPFPQYDFIDSGCCLQATGHSSYEAFLASLRGQFKDLTMQLSYTWAKNLNDTDSALPNTNPGQPQVQNPANLKTEKAISIQDVPNTFVASYVYSLPFGRNELFLNHGPLSYIVGGWQIGGIQRYQNGQPLEFCCAVGIPGWQQQIRYDLTGTPIQSAAYRSGWKHINPFNTGNGSDPTINSFFNGSDTNSAAAYTTGSAQPAFHDQVAATNTLNSIPGNNLPYTLGNTPRVTGVRMPAWMNEDFSLLKNTPIKESLSLQLKFDFLNAFNRHLFGNPDVNPADFTFGIPTYTADSPRQMQITATLTF